MNTYNVLAIHTNKGNTVKAKTAKAALINQYILTGHGKEFIKDSSKREYVNANIKDDGTYLTAFHLKVLKD